MLRIIIGVAVIYAGMDALQQGLLQYEEWESHMFLEVGRGLGSVRSPPASFTTPTRPSCSASLSSPSWTPACLCG